MGGRLRRPGLVPVWCGPPALTFSAGVGASAPTGPWCSVFTFITCTVANKAGGMATHAAGARSSWPGVVTPYWKVTGMMVTARVADLESGA